MANERANRVAGVSAVRWFHPLVGVILLVFTVVGFQQFYLHGRAYPSREITPPIRTLVIGHGIAMSAWMILFMVQPMLVAIGKRRLHMTLGRVGAGIAGAVFVLGAMVAVQSARVTPPEARIWNMPPKQFMAVPLVSVVVFAVLVAVAVWKRRRPAVHRAMMFTATLGVMSAAISRIDAINQLYTGTVWERRFGPFLGALVVGGILLVIRCAITRSFDRWMAAGMVGLVVLSAAIMAVAPTGAWDWFASLLVG
jgi:hypothetical protein